VYDFILSDLTFATTNGILTTTKTSNGHANHWAAQTLLGKVYLTMASAKETALAKSTGKVDGYKDIPFSVTDLYTKAWTVLKDVKDNSGASLLPLYDDVFKIANKNINAESLFELQFSSVVPYGTQWTKEYGMVASGTINGNPCYYTNSMVGVENLVYVPKFYKYYKAALNSPDYDKRRIWNLTDSLVNVVNNVPATLTYIWSTTFTPDSYNQTVLGRCGVTKYRWGDSWKTTSQYLYSNCPNNVIVLRFADVLLMAAEAEIEIGSLATALTYTNAVRNRAANPAGFVKDVDGTPAANYVITPYVFNDQADARTKVRFERKVELSGEGHRFFDLVRWGTANTELNAFLNYERNKTQLGALKSPDAIFHPGKDELLPIPQPQIDLVSSDVLKQNPGF